MDEDVQRSGGQHIIATEMHSNARIDRQLIGRTARQGEPGTYQCFLSLEDELLKSERRDLAVRRRGAKPDDQRELPTTWLRTFQAAQRHLESRHHRDRSKLLKQEQHRDRVCCDIGLDPLLETVDSP